MNMEIVKKRQVTVSPLVERLLREGQVKAGAWAKCHSCGTPVPNTRHCVCHPLYWSDK